MSENEVLEPAQQEVAAAPQEKMLSASEVNRVVGREKAEAAERVKRELEAKHAQELAQLRAEIGMKPEGDVSNISNQVYEQILERVAKLQEDTQKADHQKAMEDVASKYFLKMGKGPDMFEDFDAVMGDFEPSAFPQVVYLAAELENTPAVMYELSRNPQKLAAIDLMAQKSPTQAKKMLSQLSESITKNEQAKAENVSTPAPLSRPKSSMVGADTGKMTIGDMKKLPWLKG